jgi:aminopeptidase N
LIKQTRDVAELRRLCIAIARVRDPKLAQDAAQLALSNELPPQEITLRMRMIQSLRGEHPQLAWKVFTANEKQLMSSAGNLEPMYLAQFVPQAFWNSLPLDQLEAWVLAHVPKEMTPDVDKGMAGAKFKLDIKRALVPAADAYLKSRKTPA